MYLEGFFKQKYLGCILVPIRTMFKFGCWIPGNETFESSSHAFVSIAQRFYANHCDKYWGSNWEKTHCPGAFNPPAQQNIRHQFFLTMSYENYFLNSSTKSLLGTLLAPAQWLQTWQPHPLPQGTWNSDKSSQIYPSTLLPVYSACNNMKFQNLILLGLFF